MRRAARMIRSGLAVLAWLLVAGPAWAEQRFTTRDGLTASVPDDFTCGPRVLVTVRASDGQAFTGDRLALQRLLAGVRAALMADCPELQALDVSGLAAGRPVLRASVTAANGWRLPAPDERRPAEARPPPSTAPPPGPSPGARDAATAGRAPAERPAGGASASGPACEHDPRQPLVGCWWQIDPPTPQPLIGIFTREGRYYGGTAEQIAAGRSPDQGTYHRPRMYGYGNIVRLQRDGTEHITRLNDTQLQPPEFHEGCAVMELKAYGVQNFFGVADSKLYARLNARRVTATLLSDEREIDRVGRLLPDDAEVPCVDPGQATVVDHLFFPMVLGALGALPATVPRAAIASRVVMPSLGRRLAARSGVVFRSGGQAQRGAAGLGRSEAGTARASQRRLSTNIPDRGSKYNQLARRGWSRETVDEVVNNPYTTRESRNLATGNRATAYFNKDGSYIVRDDVTGDIVQYSERGNLNWIPDRNIINPYIP